jgi:ribose transport system permease protein
MREAAPPAGRHRVAERRVWRTGLLGHAANMFLPLIILVLICGIGLAEPRFLTARNLSNVLTQCSYLAVVAIAQMIVMISRGVDLSIGSTISVSSVAAAMAMTTLGLPGGEGTAILAGLAAGLGCGVAAGLVNGMAVTRLGINPVITTLATYYICNGFASILSGGRPIFDVPLGFSGLLYDGTVLGIKAPILITAAVSLAAHFILTRTVYGRNLFILGGNPRAAVVAGIPVRYRITVAYVMAGTLAALCALMLTARTGSGEPSMGTNLMLPSIAAAVVGGVSLRGGIGSVWRVLAGALFITILTNGMNLLRVNGYFQDIILGICIVLSVYLEMRLSAARKK